jgi:hypothetical protein
VPDLVLLDLMMPGRSGLETCRELKAHAKTKNIPVIVFSALGREVDRRLTAGAGADAHLTKPFNNFGLLTEVKRCLNEAKGRKFSSQIGVDHNKLLGRKILLEFEPRTDYERFVRDFAVECVFLGESVIILTQKGSSVQQALEGDEGVRFINLEHATEVLPVLTKNTESPLSLVIDNLTDLALNNSDGQKAMYKFLQLAFESVNPDRIIALFLLNPSAHDPKDVASVRGFFSNQLSYEKDGAKVARFG